VTIRRRLTIWYAVVLAVSLLLISWAAYQEFAEHSERGRRAEAEGSALDEASEILFHVGLPAVVLGVAGGWWLTRRALKPIAKLTKAAKDIDERTLDRALPRSGNGDELDELAGVLNAMQARLKDAFSQIREFTLHASHELKTPLTVMYGELETALRDNHLPAAERDRVLSQLDELGRLSKIVDGLTLLTRADAGEVKLKKEPLRLDELVRDLHGDAVILAEPAGVKVELTGCEELTVMGNAHRLRQLLLNLADNAVKYNEPGGAISMSLRRIGDTAQFDIANTGPGIALDLLPRVFDRFFRGDPAHGSGVEGCGLGLSIAQWIATAHGGTIHIESAPSKLTTVTLRVPVIAAQIVQR
jgi:signal transduction histidine kinase